MINKLKLIFTITALCSTHLLFSQNSFKMPKGYIENKENPGNGSVISALNFDLDKDGKTDFISYIIENKSSENIHEKKQYLLVYLTTIGKNQYLDFSLFAGLYGYSLEQKNEVITINVGSEGTAGIERKMKFRYNKSLKNLQLIGYDYSYHWMPGHCEKTFNLLNGNYDVTNTIYNEKTEKEIVTKKEGKKTLNIISLTELKNEKIFETLDNIGHEFEIE